MRETGEALRRQEEGEGEEERRCRGRLKLPGSMGMKSELQEEGKQGQSLCSGGKGAMEKEAEVAMEASGD